MRLKTIIATALLSLTFSATAAATEYTITQDVGHAGEAGTWLLDEQMGETSAYPFSTTDAGKVAIPLPRYTIKSASISFTLKMVGARRFYNPIKLHLIVRQGKHIANTFGPYLACTTTCPAKLLAEAQFDEQPPNEKQGPNGWEASTTSVNINTALAVVSTKVLTNQTLWLETYFEGYQAADGTGCTETWKSSCLKVYQLTPVVTLTLASA